MRKEIKYIGFYDLPGSPYKRAANLAATNKMDYICDALQRAGGDVHLISPSWALEPNAPWRQQTTTGLGPHKKLTLCASVGTKYKLTRNLKIVFSLFWLFCHLLVHAKKGEKILAYHTPWLSLPIRLAKWLKGFQLILEVEEIYGDVWAIRSLLRRQEEKLIAAATSYIAVSTILAERLNRQDTIVLYGSYSLPYASSDADTGNPPEDDGHKTVNVVYAGSIDKTKCGAYNAISCVKYLPSEYVVNILGFGSDVDVDELKKQILEINTSLGRQACIYHGTLTGNEFSRFLSHCKIAINPQKEGQYMESAFPSKIITYLLHNLRVVSTKIRSIQTSEISSFINFSESDAPDNIAQAILSIDLKAEFNSLSAIRQLDDRFVKEMKRHFCGNYD